MSSEILDRRMHIEAKKRRVQHATDAVTQGCRELTVNGSGLAELDPNGTLTATIMALVPIACRTVGYDITLLLSEQPGWGVRLRLIGEDPEVTAVQIAPPNPDQPAGADQPPGATADTTVSVTPQEDRPVGIVAELAALLRG